MQGKLLDPDEKVRLATVTVFENMNLASLITIPLGVIESIYERCMDKKVIYF